jgi:hypothetical protein
MLSQTPITRTMVLRSYCSNSHGRSGGAQACPIPGVRLGRLRLWHVGRPFSSRCIARCVKADCSLASRSRDRDGYGKIQPMRGVLAQTSALGQRVAGSGSLPLLGCHKCRNRARGLSPVQQGLTLRRYRFLHEHLVHADVVPGHASLVKRSSKKRRHSHRSSAASASTAATA